MKKNVERKASKIRLHSKITDEGNPYHIERLTALEKRIVDIIGKNITQEKVHTRFLDVSSSKKKVIKNIINNYYV